MSGKQKDLQQGDSRHSDGSGVDELERPVGGDADRQTR